MAAISHPAPVSSELHVAVAGRLRSDDQRYTSGRRALVDLLVGAERPLTIAELLARGSGIAQSSAYRNLAVLEQAGVVRRVVTDDEFARFELAEDLTGHHHHHLICTTCGRVEDFTIAGHLERTLDRAFGQVATDTGFSITDHRLDLVGTCSGCT